MSTPLLTKYISTYSFNQTGALLLTGGINVMAYSKLNLMVFGSSPAGHTVTVEVDMGLISGMTVASRVLQFPLQTVAKIYTLDIVGPEMSIVLSGGPPNGSLALEAWTFLQ